MNEIHVPGLDDLGGCPALPLLFHRPIDGSGQAEEANYGLIWCSQRRPASRQWYRRDRAAAFRHLTFSGSEDRPVKDETAAPVKTAPKGEVLIGSCADDSDSSKKQRTITPQVFTSDSSGSSPTQLRPQVTDE